MTQDTLEPTSPSDPTGQTGPPPKPSRPRFFFAFALLAVLAFLVGGAGGSFESKLTDVQKNDNSAFLPSSAESTKVANESDKFITVQNIPGFLVYQRIGGLTDADKAKVTADRAKIAALSGVDGTQLGAPQYSSDGTTASLSVPLVASRGGTDLTGPQLSDNEKAVIKIAQTGDPAGLVAHSAGAGGLLVAFIDAFQGIDGKLLGIAGVVVIVLLLLVYRSPVVWVFPLFSAVLALGLSSIVIYVLAKNDVITLNGQSQGILSVLVIGAGTDYALLLISRYREELHDYEDRVDAMIRAWRGAAPPIFASACTVVIGLLCLLVSELNSNRGLGPVCALGIASTLFMMLFFLPVALLFPSILMAALATGIFAGIGAGVLGGGGAALGLLPLAVFIGLGFARRRARRSGREALPWFARVPSGRWIFWPRTPRVDHAVDIASHGMWGKVAASVGRHPRRFWAITAVVLFGAVALLPGLRTNGLPITDGFTNTPDALVGQRIYDSKFDQGAGTPAVITTNASQESEVMAAAAKVKGVATGAGAVCVQPDYTKLAAAIKAAAASGATPPVSTAGCLPDALNVAPIDGRTVINAQLTASYDSQPAYDAIKALRQAVHAIPGADAEVGGQAAIQLDTLDASARDSRVIIPLVLVVILVVLMILLRALLAPLLLIATVVLSFTATLGICSIFFNHIFNFANADPSFPLFAFIFLVALGIDYNIFLMTRVREETLQFGTRSGVLRGLSVTGGVITSAGLVLASTFAVLGVLPIVFLAEIGFAVAFGVLLDTFIVRSLLVPALSYDLGRVIWWPSRLARAEQPGPARPGLRI
jgi:putative drug exporter of the RND superfamily